MTGSPFLNDFVKEAVLVAVHQYPGHALYMPALFPFLPDFFPAPAIEMGKPGAGGQPDCFIVGVRDHQHLMGPLVLDNDGDKSVLVM